MRQTGSKEYAGILPTRTRRLLGALITIIALCGLAGAISIPFYFESSSILYKFGPDRWILRTAQVLGVVAGYLFICQIMLGARLRVMDRFFGLNNLYRYHRLIGMLILCMVMLHPILIFISDDRFFIPFQLRYWPEFVGLFLLMILVAMVLTAYWRSKLNIAFHRWWPMHRIAGIAVAAIFFIHLFFANDSYQQSFSEKIAWTAVTFCGLIFIWIWTRQLRRSRHHYMVSSIEPAAKDALRLVVGVSESRVPIYSPGQFCFMTFHSQNVSKEEHPFTISSSPTQSGKLEFIIRTTGDWTGKLHHLQPGDRVIIDGPYGHFSHISVPEAEEIIMIAGGIGITPFLSMLRYMADMGDPRKITLIWSNQTAEHVVAKEEFDSLESNLYRFSFHQVITRASEAGAQDRRLDGPYLQKRLSNCSAAAAIFICGPDQMMSDVSNHLVRLGCHKSMIHTERFSL